MSQICESVIEHIVAVMKKEVKYLTEALNSSVKIIDLDIHYLKKEHIYICQIYWLDKKNIKHSHMSMIDIELIKSFKTIKIIKIVNELMDNLESDIKKYGSES